MSIKTNARVAGFTFLLYIVAGISSMALASHKNVTTVIGLITSLCALVLAVTLYALTRVVDADLALLALTCRVIEAIPGHEAEFFFAVGSTIFAWLFLRGRLIPAAIAWLGVFASALLVIVLPIQRAGLLGGKGSWSSSVTWLQWMPALVFEIALAVWLLTKGVTSSAPSRA